MYALRTLAVVLLLAGIAGQPQIGFALPPIHEPTDPIDPVEPPELGCVSNDDCDDGNLCNGEERCVGTGKFRRCTLGEPLRCLDRNLCTIDSCDPVEGCRHEPTDCPTTTTLPPATTTTTAPPSTSTTSASSTSTSTTSTTRPHDGCGAAPTCDDADPCTTDACGAGGCTHDERPGLGYVACVLDERLSPLLRDAQTAATSGRARRLAKKAIAREAKVSALLTKIMDGAVSSRRLTRSARLIGSLGRMIERGRGQLGDAPADAIGGEVALAGARLKHEIGVPAGR